jgi:glycosyltransferase involved in cell wall biosynthesis
LPRARFFEHSGWSYYLGIRKTAEKIHRELPFDIIHAHVALPDGYGALLLNKSYRKPLIVTIHGLDVMITIYRNARCWENVKKVFGTATRVICVSTALKNLCLQVDEADETKFRVIPNGFSLRKEFHDHTYLKDKYKGKLVLLTVGYLIKRKAHEYVIRALGDSMKRMPNLVYLIVGEGPEEDRLKRLVGRLGLSDYVEFCGRKDHETVMKYMSICDLFVMPSWDEAFGVVYLEAMAHGKPVIACRGQGIEDVVVDGETGLLVKPKDLESLKEAMIKLLTDRRLAEDMGQRGKQVVLSAFTWEKSAQKLMGIYREVLSGR